MKGLLQYPCVISDIFAGQHLTEYGERRGTMFRLVDGPHQVALKL